MFNGKSNFNFYVKNAIAVFNINLKLLLYKYFFNKNRLSNSK